MKIAALLALVATSFACASTGAPVEASPAQPASAEATKLVGPPNLPPVSPAKADYYRRALPGAARFVPRAIPSHMLRSADVGNDVYVEAYALDGTKLGVLRDFVGPVSTSANCPCDPLNLTLVFGPDLGFSTLIAPAPLTKLGHEPMSEAEVQRLVDILKSPPPELLEARSPDDVVDVTTGATKPAYADFVVPKAGLETRRLVGLVQDTQAILRDAPVTWDRQVLAEILRLETPAARAQALATFLPRALSDDLAFGAYRMMGREYVTSGAAPPHEAIEERLLDRAVLDRVGAGVLGEVCYALASEGLRLVMVDRCVEEVKRRGLDESAVALIRGTAAFHRKAMREALDDLSLAAGRVQLALDPGLHARLAQAFEAVGRRADACDRAAELYREHSLLEATRALVERCKQHDDTYVHRLARIEDDVRHALLGQDRRRGEPAPELELEDENMQPVKVRLGEAGKITIAVFFSTWCPHCQVELPKLARFQREVAADPALAGRVRLVGIRTAVERETEPWADFAARFALGFPVWTDATMSIALNDFARAHEVKPGLPTLVVVDERGVVRFFVPHGEYRDTARDLRWIIARVSGS